MPFQMNENGHARQDLDKDGVHRILRIKFKGIDCKKCKKIYKQKLSLKSFFSVRIFDKNSNITQSSKHFNSKGSKDKEE